MIPEVYDNCATSRRNYLGGERVNHTLQATRPVHEAYLRLREQRKVDWRIARSFSASPHK